MLGYLTRYYDWPFHPSTLVLRRVVWERVGPFNPAYALADTDWFVRAVEQFPAAMLARHGVYNRRHAGNWSNRLGSARMQREIFEIVEGAIDRRWPKPALPRRVWRAVVENECPVAAPVDAAGAAEERACRRGVRGVEHVDARHGPEAAQVRGACRVDVHPSGGAGGGSRSSKTFAKASVRCSQSLETCVGLQEWSDGRMPESR